MCRSAAIFVDVTIFDGVNHGMTIEREEIFGPVMGILAWDDEAAMLREVNDTDYGLCANIWTNDLSTALRMADAVEAGYVWINGTGAKRLQGRSVRGLQGQWRRARTFAGRAHEFHPAEERQRELLSVPIGDSGARIACRIVDIVEATRTKQSRRTTPVIHKRES
jgi:hypothetical protein